VDYPNALGAVSPLQESKEAQGPCGIHRMCTCPAGGLSICFCKCCDRAELPSPDDDEKNIKPRSERQLFVPIAVGGGDLS
jgi:hypothetical protein